MATANASGDFQLPLVFIHKSAKPLCFSGINVSALPVHYNCQISGWMDSLIFKDWFNKHFIATVTKYLESKSLSPQALLLLDNVPSHSFARMLLSADGKVKCLFLPPNVTSLIQPMDQDVIENIKGRYKKHLLRKLLLGSTEHDSFLEFPKSLPIKDVVFLSAKSWDKVSSLSLSHAWSKLGFGPQSDSLQEELPELSDDWNQLGITEAEKEEWLTMDDSETGVQELTDEDIIGMVQASSS